jgi:hypothetical protein
MGLELWRTVPDGAREVLPGEKCPRCQGTRTRRSRARSLAERFLRTVTPLRPFACSACGWRGWRLPDTSVGPEVPLPPLPAGRKFHRSSGSTQRQELALRIIRQVIVAALVAFIAGNLFTRCQNDAAAMEVSSPSK